MRYDTTAGDSQSTDLSFHPPSLYTDPKWPESPWRHTEAPTTVRAPPLLTTALPGRPQTDFPGEGRGEAGSLGAQGDRAEGPWKRHRGPGPPHEPSCGHVPATGPSHCRPSQLGSVNCNLSLCVSAQKLNSVFPLLQIEIKPINSVHRSLINATLVTTSDTGKALSVLNFLIKPS